MTPGLAPSAPRLSAGHPVPLGCLLPAPGHGDWQQLGHLDHLFTCDPQPGSDYILLLSTPPAMASWTCDLSRHTGAHVQSTRLDALL